MAIRRFTLRTRHHGASIAPLSPFSVNISTNQTFSLFQDGTIRQVIPTEEMESMLWNISLHKKMPVPHMRSHYLYENWEYDEDYKTLSRTNPDLAEHYKRIESLYKFLKTHNSVSVKSGDGNETNRNLGNMAPLFILIDETEQVNKEAEMEKQKNKARRILDEVYEQDEMTFRSWGIGMGLPVHNIPIDEAYAKVMRMINNAPQGFFEFYNNKDKDITILAWKAIKYKRTNSPDDTIAKDRNGVITINNEVYATSFSEFIAKLKLDSTMYGFVKREVDKYEAKNMGAELAKSAVEAKVVAQTPPIVGEEDDEEDDEEGLDKEYQITGDEQPGDDEEEDPRIKEIEEQARKIDEQRAAANGPKSNLNKSPGTGKRGKRGLGS